MEAFAANLGCVVDYDLNSIQLQDAQTGETILELKRDVDYFYDKSGSLYLSNAYYDSFDYIEYLQTRYGIEAGSDARVVLESLGYEIDVYETNTMGRRIFISGNGLHYTFFDGTAGLKADKNNNIIFTSKWTSDAQIKQLLNPERTKEVMDNFLNFSQKVQSGGDFTLAEIEALYLNYEWVQDVPEVTNALKPLYENDEFVDLLEQCYDNLGLDLYLPETELSAGEMLFYSLYSIISGEVLDSGNEKFDTALKLVNFAIQITPAGFARKYITKLVVKKAASKVLPKLFDLINTEVGDNIKSFLQSELAKKLKNHLDRLEIGADAINWLADIIEGAYLINDEEAPEWIQTVLDYLK